MLCQDLQKFRAQHKIMKSKDFELRAAKFRQIPHFRWNPKRWEYFNTL